MGNEEVKGWGTNDLEDERFEIEVRIVETFIANHPEDEDVVRLQAVNDEIVKRQEEEFNKL